MFTGGTGFRPMAKWDLMCKCHFIWWKFGECTQLQDVSTHAPLYHRWQLLTAAHTLIQSRAAEAHGSLVTLGNSETPQSTRLLDAPTDATIAA